LGSRFCLGVSAPLAHTLATLPKPTEQQSQNNQKNPGEQVDSQVELHDQPLHLVENGLSILRLELSRMNRTGRIHDRL
jgi:hypothetical protein